MTPRFSEQLSWGGKKSPPKKNMTDPWDWYFLTTFWLIFYVTVGRYHFVILVDFF